MVCNFRNMDLGLDASYRSGCIRYHLNLLLPQCPVCFVISRNVYLERNQHPEDLLFVHLHAAADGITVRRRIFSCCGDEIFSSQKQSGTLRAAEAFATGKTNKIEA